MTNEEKLRALLAEARGVISEDYDRGTPSVMDRIDAALAETVGECAGCSAALTARDEARAEIGRLRGLLSICEEAFEVIGDSNHSRAHATAAAMLAELAPEVDSWTNDR